MAVDVVDACMSGIAKMVKPRWKQTIKAKKRRRQAKRNRVRNTRGARLFGRASKPKLLHTVAPYALYI